VHAAETGGIGLDPGGIFDGIMDALKGLPDAIIQGITEWFRKKLVEYDREASTTMISYIPNPEAMSNPKYKILTLNANLMELAADNGGIAWHYRFKAKAN
jgi:hypothetical protein